MRPVRRLGRLAIAAVLVSAAPGRPARADDDPSGGQARARLDCGTAALHSFLRFAGRPTELGRLQQVLGERPEAGFSLADLRRAAQRVGLRTVGRNERVGSLAPDGPRLAFVRRAGHGHFVAVRPVGHTGRLVQVVDLGREPAVLDASRLYAAPEWTGLVLAPGGPPWGTTAGAGAIAAALILPLVLAARSTRQRRRDRLAGSPASSNPSVVASGESLPDLPA